MVDDTTQKGKATPGFTYLLSDTLDHDLPVLVTDSLAEVQAFLGDLKRGSLSTMMYHRQLIKKRYRLERVDIRENSGVEKGF